LPETETSALKLVFVGHVDHGKSTIIGRLLHDTGSLPEGVVERARRIARETGQPFEYAYLLDAFEEEQKQGITIDTTQIQFRTKKREYVIIDAPGHKEFLKNMISGASGAEAAFLIIDANEGVREQSKRHAYILSLLGIKAIYVVLNKMDLAAYSRDVYEGIRRDMGEFLESLGVSPIDYIPVSGYEGDNVLSPSPNLPWFGGKPLIEAMDSIEKTLRPDDEPLRFPIQDVYKFDERRIIAGRVERGSLAAGDEIVVYPSGRKTRVKTLEFWAARDVKDRVNTEESVGVTLEDEFFNKRGEVIAVPSAPLSVSRRFRANLFWMGSRPASAGRKYKIKIATDEVTGQISEISRIIDASTLDAAKSSSEISMNDVAEVTIETDRAIAFDTFAECAPTGRFVIVEDYDVSGGGIITAPVDTGETSRLFRGGGISFDCDIFREFYFNLAGRQGQGKDGADGSYAAGDSLPLKGNSYNYPADFDLICAEENAAVKVREAKIADILSLDKYEFTYMPLIDGKGFAIKASDPSEFLNYLQAFRNLDAAGEKRFFDRWLRFEQYRTMIFHSGFWAI
jgi:sulfate adenylyltransferase large subunit